MFKQMILAAAVAGVVLAMAAAAGAGVSGIDQLTIAGQSMLFVPVGDQNNAADTQVRSDSTTGYGSVGYLYDLGKYEVTNAQYTVFLKDAAKTTQYSTTWGLYYPATSRDAYCNGITRSGTSPNFTYALVTNFTGKPVNYVNWNNAAAFCNWLTTGDVNTGYYSMNSSTGVATPNAFSHIAYAKINGLTYFIPTEDEWYKAAYYKGGTTNAYWDYPTQSDTAPGTVTASSTGVGSAGSAGNYANTGTTVHWKTGDSYGNVTTVGTNGGPGYYGTFDIGGNVWEWNEGIPVAGNRGMLGGSFYSDVAWLPAAQRASYAQAGVFYGMNGFRVSAVPEPATMCLLAFGGLVMLMGRRRRVRV